MSGKITSRAFKKAPILPLEIEVVISTPLIVILPRVADVSPGPTDVVFEKSSSEIPVLKRRAWPVLVVTSKFMLSRRMT